MNNYVGVYDAGKMVARAEEGIHYCSFSTDAALKAPIADINAYPPIGVSLASSDQPLGFNNYAAASIDHSSFQHLNIGINGTGQQLRIVDNTFDYCWRAAIDLDFTPNGQGFFSFTPMYVERNNIMVRGANPRESLTSWGILGGVYAKDNYIHGDAVNPASNSVEQVGMYMISPDNSTQTANTFERLDKGIEAGVDNWFSGQERDISGNLFRDVVQGISFFTPYYYTTPIGYRQLHIRCNSFENPANLAGAVALAIEGPTFPAQIGDAANGNGNRFVTPGLPSIEPIVNLTGPFTYFYYGSSTQEIFSQATLGGYLVQRTGGNPVTACTNAGYNNGITNRSAVTKPSISQTQIQNAYDSLGLSSTSTIRQHTLLNTLFAATTQRQDFASLEAYLTSLPLSSKEVHAQLGTWLLRTYRAAHREPDAQRMRAALLTRHPADLEVRSFVQLSDALMHLAQRTGPLDAPAPADVTALRQVAASGTTAARVACPIARRYEPACPCRFAGIATASAQAVAQREAAPTSNKAGLGVPYPNPASATIHLPYVLTTGGGGAKLEIRNALGQIVKQVELTAPVGEAQLSVYNLPVGLYSCTLRGVGQRYAVRRFAVIN